MMLLSGIWRMTLFSLISFTIVLVRMSILFSLKVDSVYEISCYFPSVVCIVPILWTHLLGEHGEHGGQRFDEGDS